MYEYVTDNNLENRQNYMYSEFGGKDFLKAYFDSRLGFSECTELSGEVEGEGVHITRRDVSNIYKTLESKEDMDEICYLLDLYVKTFEVRKRLYTEYDDKWKPVHNAGYNEYDLYIDLSECCLLYYQYTNCTKYLSCALKLNDSLLSIEKLLTVMQKNRLKRTLAKEIDAVNSLALRLGVEVAI